MPFSQTAEYALRAAVHIAANQGHARTTQQIAEATQVPAGYLSKVLNVLSRASLVRAQRGLGGGFTLERPAEDITALQVVNAVDPIHRITECPLGREEHRNELCPLHRKLDEAMGCIEDAFAVTTLADLLETVDGSKPLCEVTVTGQAKTSRNMP